MNSDVHRTEPQPSRDQQQPRLQQRPEQGTPPRQPNSPAQAPAAPEPAASRPSNLVRIEAAALLDLADRLDTTSAQPFARAVDLLVRTASAGHRVLLTGIGKSGIIARKIAATLRSTGTPAHFLHPTEALHGDLGMLTPGDVVVALSASGETEELLTLLPLLQRVGSPLVAVCGCPTSNLAAAAHLNLDVSISGEACPHNLAPTASTTVMLALGDALALSVSQRRGFEPHHFADLHPGGRLGKRLTRVRDLMHTGDAVPTVTPDTLLPDIIYEMSRKKLGITTVSSLDPAQLLGLISDGDLRRLLGRDGARALNRTAAEILNPHPITIPPETYASAALALMEERRITTLLVVDQQAESASDTPPNLQGVVHLHDLWALQLP